MPWAKKTQKVGTGVMQHGVFHHGIKTWKARLFFCFFRTNFENIIPAYPQTEAALSLFKKMWFFWQCIKTIKKYQMKLKIIFSLPFGLELDFLKAIFLHYSCPRSRAPQRPQWNLARRVLLALRQAVKKPLLVKLSCGKTHPSGNPWHPEGYEWMVFDDCLFCWSTVFVFILVMA